MHSTTAITLTALVLVYAVVSAQVKRWYVAPALIFVVLGMALGPFGLGMLDAGDDTHVFTVLAQLALTVILFNQAAGLDVTGAWRRGRTSFRLLAVGIPLTLVLGSLTALLLLPVLPLWEAVCLAAIIAPTEAVLIEALLEDHRIPDRVRHALSVETGFYDGFALATLLAALALASQHAHRDDATNWVWLAVRTEVLSVLVGLAVGTVGALLIVYSVRRAWMSPVWAQLATLAVALLCFQTSEAVHASGFVAAFVGGLTYAVLSRHFGLPSATQVSDAAGQLLELLVFAMFGAYAVVVGWRDAGWQVIVFALVAVFVVRLIAVSVALLGSGVARRSRLFIGWFGLRGIGSLVLGLIVLDRGTIGHADVITQAVVVAVTLSLVLHSITAPVGIRLVSRDRLAQ